jgi:hypothetical protein
MEQIVTRFREWIRTSLSTPAPFLNGMPPCPYARDAMVQRRFGLHVFAGGSLEAFIEEHLRAFTVAGCESVIFIDPALVSGAELEATVLHLRKKFFRQNVWPLYDHPALPEVQGDMCFNFKECALVIIQGLSTLVEASRELQKRGYYDNWSADYYHQVVGAREQHYLLMLEESPAAAVLV